MKIRSLHLILRKGHDITFYFQILHKHVLPYILRKLDYINVQQRKLFLIFKYSFILPPSSASEIRQLVETLE